MDLKNKLDLEISMFYDLHFSLLSLKNMLK